MKIVGFLLIIIYWNSLNYQFSFTGLFGLLFGVCLCLGAEGLQYLERTVRYIHRDRK